MISLVMALVVMVILTVIGILVLTFSKPETNKDWQKFMGM